MAKSVQGIWLSEVTCGKTFKGAGCLIALILAFTVGKYVIESTNRQTRLGEEVVER